MSESYIKYWICQCGSINDEKELSCRGCSGTQDPIAWVRFHTEEDLIEWIGKVQKHMGAKVYRFASRKT